MRPKVVPRTPLEYEELMVQCWDADPLKRPDAKTLWKKLNDINIHYQSHQSIDEEPFPSDVDVRLNTNANTSSSFLDSLVKKFNSKVYIFEEPKNATSGK